MVSVFSGFEDVSCSYSLSKVISALCIFLKIISEAPLCRLKKIEYYSIILGFSIVYTR